MAGLSDLLGANGVIEQLLLWNVVGQVVSAMATPAFTELVQDAQQAHPEVALAPDVLAGLVARHLATEADARAQARKSGMPPGSFDLIREAARIRLSPADLAQAVLRSYLPRGDAEREALPQGFTADMFKIATDLQGDAPGPQQLAEALRRGIIDRRGRGADSTSFDQGISESRLHDKWADMVAALTREIISPPDAADAAVRNYLPYQDAEREAAKSGVDAALFRVMYDLAGDAPGPQQLAEALQRGIIRKGGTGAAAVSFEQGIAEGRLHDKWAPVIERLAAAILSPPDAASAVVRNFLAVEAGEDIAAQSGVDKKTFTTMRHLAGDAPGPQQLAEALRRGAIDQRGKGADSTSFEQGIAEGRLADKWAPVIKDLAKLWPTPVDALNALLKGAFDEREAKKLYAKLGGDDQFFDWLFFSQGEAPTPLELISMANRGFIPWDGVGQDKTSYAQGFHEGRWRNKWEDVYRKFAEYLPDPSTIVTLVKDGAMTSATAAPLLAQHGMSHQVITAYLDEAHTLALSDYRGATTSVVTDSYYAEMITRKQAITILVALHVTEQAAELILNYVDVKRAFDQVNAAVSRIRTLYAARKITKQTAQDSLKEIGVPFDQIPKIVATWSVENSITVKTLTEAQIADAFQYDIFTQAEAMTELENIGYTPFDAWAVLSIKAKGVLKGKPSQGPAPAQGTVRPGTT